MTETFNINIFFAYFSLAVGFMLMIIITLFFSGLFF